MARTPKRLLRILLAGSALAAAILAVDLLSSHESASAVDLVPDTLSAVTTPVAPVVDAVAETSAPVVAPVASTITSLITPIIDPVASGVLTPLEPAVTALTEPLAPVAHAALDPLVPALQPLLPVVADLVGVVPVASLAAAAPNAALVVGGLLVVGAVGAASVPLLPLPGNSPSPRNAPVGAVPLSVFTFFAETVAGLVAALRSVLSAPAPAELTPLSPTFASDTTPD